MLLIWIKIFLFLFFLSFRWVRWMGFYELQFCFNLSLLYFVPIEFSSFYLLSCSAKFFSCLLAKFISCCSHPQLSWTAFVYEFHISWTYRVVIIIIIIIKKGRKCKAEREWYTPYQSEDPSPPVPAIDIKKRKGKRVEDYSRDRAA